MTCLVPASQTELEFTIFACSQRTTSSGACPSRTPLGPQLSTRILGPSVEGDSPQ